MLDSIFSFFTDPILRAPTLGSVLMCLSAGLVGTLVFLRKQSLIGEALSHAAYPGIILGVFAAGAFSVSQEAQLVFSLFILVGASLTAFLGLWCIHKLEKKFHFSSDSSLCFVLSAFFGVGITLASEAQFSYTSLYKQAQIFIYGQAATMTDIHVWIYAILAFGVIVTIFLLYKEIQILTFDRVYAASLGIRTRPIDTIILILLVMAIIIGIRSVGVVLMSAMLIAPPVAARQFTNRLSWLFSLSAFFGLLSGFIGIYFSVNLTEQLAYYYPAARIILPTGPSIVLTAFVICLSALLFAPQRGFLVRSIRVARFHYKSLCENVLKAIWRTGKSQVDFKDISLYQSCSSVYLRFIVSRMVVNGWLKKRGSNLYSLTQDGYQRAVKIIRLHRLWELYLADYLGVGGERVHRNAEEMEHILTPEIEKELTALLNNPKEDPHRQPIPQISKENRNGL